MGIKESRGELVQGTLDLLVLKVLSRKSNHGWGIAKLIQEDSREVLRIEEGSLYPALRRLERQGFVKGEWSQSDNNRRARYYALTPKGRRHLVREHEHWRSLVLAMSLVLET